MYYTSAGRKAEEPEGSVKPLDADRLATVEALFFFSYMY